MSKRISEKPVYKTQAETEIVDLVNGKMIKKRIMKSSGPGSVTIIPVIDESTVLLVRQYRPALRKPGNAKDNGWIFELPGGHTETGETLKEAARRELEEELGYTAKEIRFLYSRHFTPWSSDAIDNVFVAKGLKKGSRSLDSDESMYTVRANANKVMKMLRNGKIKDVSTRDGLLYWLLFLRKTA